MGFTPTGGAGVGLAVTVNGTNLTGATAVSFNGTSQPTFTVVSATQITTTVPAGATTGTIQVTTPDGTATSASFVVVPTPTITGFTPTTQGEAGSLTITGTNLSSATAITFGGGPTATIANNSATSITVTVPAGSASGNVSVTTPGGTAALAGFTFAAPPDMAVTAPLANATVSGAVPVTYTVTQAQAVRADVRVEYDASGLGTFLPANTKRCTQASSAPSVEPNGVQGVTTSASGTSHTFLWNSTADLPTVTTLGVALRVRASLNGVFGSSPAPVTGITVANGLSLAAAVNYGVGATPTPWRSGT